MIVTVVYWRVVDMAAARRCQRCGGEGVERYVPGTCPHCTGTGVKPFGYAYDAAGLDLRVGDIVEVPRTPRTRGDAQHATVVDVDVTYPNPTRSVVRKVAAS
jgi:hypothetical protein